MQKPHPTTVAEIQGPYGPLQVLESNIQKIWAFQHLQAGDWRTRTGERISIRTPGRWNHGAGPDFKEAVLEINDRLRIGDVEIHLYREDWWRHGHAVDPAYNEVILHVVLFSGGMQDKVLTESGAVPCEWELGPWVREDVEAISGGSPGLFGELVPEVREWLESDEPVRIRERLMTGADRRWQDKVSMARCLLEHNGWEEGLHRMSLYYLGYPLNRRVFYQIAETVPLSKWACDSTPEMVRRNWEEAVRWKCGRPANRPHRRLRQYAQLNREVPCWTNRLSRVPQRLRMSLARELKNPRQSQDTKIFRRRADNSQWEHWLLKEVLADQFSLSLARRLWIDAYLPMMVATGCLSYEEAHALWFHGHAATHPEAYRSMLKMVLIQADPRYTHCNGWVQGILWLEDQLRMERVRLATGGNTIASSGSDA